MQLEIFTSGDGLLGLRFITGTIEDGRLVAYEPQPGDVVVEDGRLFNDDVEIGTVVGSDDGFLLTVDRYEASPFENLFTRTNAPDQPSNAAIDRVADWSVTVDGVAVPIEDLFRKSKIVESARLEGFQRAFVQEHVIHLDLGDALVEGSSVSIAAPGGLLSETLLSETVTIDTGAMRSDAVHVNQVGFAPDDVSKIAVLSTWLGVDTDRPENAQQFENGVDYAEGTLFHVVDVATGERVFSDEIELLVAAEDPNTFANGGRPAVNLAYADTWVMDFSELEREGSYVVEVEGVGTSYAFEIAGDVWQDLFEIGARGFYHQRSGIALEAEYTDWERPRSLSPEDGQVAFQSTTTILETANGYLPESLTGLTEIDTFTRLEENSTGEIVEGAWGGWHDAGDWDRRVQHLEASDQMMELVDLNPAYFEGVGLNIPESGNALPDLLDEALWTVDLFQRLQRADGGVPGGIEGGTVDGVGFQYGEASWANSRPLYVYGSDPWSSALFAGSAARAARVVEDYDAERAAGYLADAIAAFDWAVANWIEPRTDVDAFGTQAVAADQNLVDARNLAALELYRATGDERYEAEFVATSSFRPGAYPDGVPYWAHQTDAAYAYLTMDAALQDADLAATIRADFLALAELTLDNYGRQSGFDTSDNPFAPYFFSATGTNPEQAADLLVRAHALTGDERFLADAIDDANFALGMNPDNVSFVSGVGDEPVRELLIADAEALGGALPPGIVAYGNWDAVGNGERFWHERGAQATFPENPANWPGYESWQGFFDAVPITEFTVDEPMGSSVYLWGYLAQLNGEAAAPQPPTEPPTGPPPDPGLLASTAYEVQLGTTATFILADGGFTARQIGIGDTLTFADGVTATLSGDASRTRLLLEDASDAYAWSETRIVADTGDERPWDRIDTVTGDDGETSARTAAFDDGRITQIAFEDGVRMSSASSDPNGARRWDTVETRFDGTGTIVSSSALYDDGTTSWVNYENGEFANVTRSDPADVRPWDTIYTEYDDGERQATYRTDDDGDVVSTFFEDGARERVVVFDGSDTRDWETRTTFYDADGNVADIVIA